jgi:hypothetical protein
MFLSYRYVIFKNFTLPKYYKFPLMRQMRICKPKFQVCKLSNTVQGTLQTNFANWFAN